MNAAGGSLSQRGDFSVVTSETNADLTIRLPEENEKIRGSCETRLETEFSASASAGMINAQMQLLKQW